MDKIEMIVMALDNQSDRLDKSIENQAEMSVNIAKITSCIEVNTRDLTHHIKRTDLLQKDQEETKARLEKIEKSHSMVSAIWCILWKIFLGLGAAATAIYGIIELFKHFM